MPWLTIWMNEQAMTTLRREAEKRGYHLTVREKASEDLFEAREYLFVSGLPQRIVLEILAEYGIGYDMDGKE